jgi:hypothetical protein
MRNAVLSLYRSANLLTHWIAWSERGGWVRFPAKPNGWSERTPYRGDSAGLMAIPPRLAFNTGFPHPDATPVRAIDEHVFAVIRATSTSRRRVA